MSQALDEVVIRALEPLLDEDHVILNIPSGDGDLSRQIEERGGRVVSSDLFPEFSRYKPAEVVKADMNDRLPFSDDSFDGLVCQEGIEHLENLPFFIAECRRVLRNGGHLVFTTPNYMDLSSRFSFFLTGIKGFRGNYPNEESTIWGMANGSLYHGHAFTLPFFQIRYLLRLSHFDRIRLEGVKSSGVSRTLYYLMRPLMGLAVGFITRRRARRDRREQRPAVTRGVQAELNGFALSRDLLVGKTILVEARCAEGSFEPGSGLQLDSVGDSQID